MKLWTALPTRYGRSCAVQQLPDKVFKVFVTLRCLAGELDQGGLIPALEECAWAMHLSITQIRAAIDRITNAGLLVTTPGGLVLSDWDDFGERRDAQHAEKNQEKAPAKSNRERQRDHRERRRVMNAVTNGVTEGVTETVTGVTEGVTETVTSVTSVTPYITTQHTTSHHITPPPQHTTRDEPLGATPSMWQRADALDIATRLAAIRAKAERRGERRGGSDERVGKTEQRGGGEEKAVSSEKPLVAGDLIFPPCLGSDAVQSLARDVLATCNGSAQALLDELAARAQQNDIKSPLGYLRGLVTRYKAGEFTPDASAQVAAKRESAQRVQHRISDGYAEGDSPAYAYTRDEARKLGIDVSHIDTWNMSPDEIDAEMDILGRQIREARAEQRVGRYARAS